MNKNISITLQRDTTEVLFGLVSVCLQDCTKITDWISTRQRWRTGLGPEQNL